MGSRLHFLEYDINLSDRVLLAELQATRFLGAGVGVVGKIQIAPTEAAITYEAPIIEGTTPIVSPSITSPWFGTDDNFPRNERTFLRRTGGLFGIGILFGTKHTYYWRGTFQYLPAVTPTQIGPGVPDPIAQRRWIDGFETAATNEPVARTASRHTQGLGLALRDSTFSKSHGVADLVAGLTPSTSWERFYIRPRLMPAAQKVFWRSRITTTTQAGIALALTPTGQIAAFQVDAASVMTLMGSAAVPTVLEEWVRVDILLKVGSGAAFYLFLNGKSQLSVTGIAGDVGTVGRTHLSSEVGSAGAATWALDVDDWMCAEWPTSAPTMLNPGADWRSGSRMALVRPTGFGTGNVWTGDWRVLLQNPESGLGFGPTTELISIVSGAQLSVTTDYGAEVNLQPGQVGIAAIMVGAYQWVGSAGNGQLGYAIDGAAAVLATITQALNPQWNYAIYRPAALPEGEQHGTIELVHTKAPNVATDNVYALQAQVEILGIFDATDHGAQGAVESFDDLTFEAPVANIHNAPYPRTPWATSKVPPIAPIAIYGGTYVGNAAGVEIAFKTPIHFWWSRRVTTLGAGTKWFSSLNAAHDGFSDALMPELLVQALEDPDYVAADGEDQQGHSYKVRITGAHAQGNNPGDTYAYVAVSDPGGRFLLTGALKNHKGTANIDTALVNAGFLPEAGFIFKEGQNATTQLHYKGPGHAAASLSNLGAAETANALTWTAGHLVSQSALHNAATDQIGVALFRREDGNTKDAASTDPYGEVVQIASYTGDGTASRTVSLAPLSGKRPLFALVVPHNAAGMYRDHQHTTTTSTTIPNTNNAATGITGGGIDSISVGSVLNANGIVYDVFVLPGSDTAVNGGFSGPGEFFPRPPDNPIGGPFEDLPEDPAEVEEPVAPVDPDTTSPVPAWPTGCIGATTQLINMALSRLGHTKLIVNVDTDQTVEATLARLHYTDAMNAVLRAWPWPFATRYATLVNIPAVPVTDAINEDWQYAYRAPADLLFARRFVKRGSGLQRTWDDAPFTFRMGSDATGPLIYTNATPADAILEYTVNVACPATAGDALFRSAYAWRMAHELAPGLSKDAKAAAYCYAMYKEQLPTAETAAANEQQQDIEARDASWIRDRE